MDRKGGCAIAIIGGIGLSLMAAGAYAFLGAATLENYEQYPWIVALFILGLAMALTCLVLGGVKVVSGEKDERPREQKTCAICGCRVKAGFNTCTWCGAEVK